MISRESRIPRRGGSRSHVHVCGIAPCSRRGREQTMANEGGKASGEIDDDGHVVGGALALALVAVDGRARYARGQGR